jgi:LAS superfamily LD-carboxypeptidase LdcB
MAMSRGAWGGYANGRIPASAMVEVDGFLVAPSVADNLEALLDAAQRDGVWRPGERFATGTYRSYEDQVRLWQEHLAGTHPAPVAEPGTSLHGWGEAIDFNTALPGFIDWLAANADRFGFRNLPGESWHYSSTGS